MARLIHPARATIHSYDSVSDERMVKFETSDYALTTDTDSVVVFDIPKGRRIVDWYVAADDLDTNGTPTIALALRLLDANDFTTTEQNLITGLTTGQAGGVSRPTGVGAVPGLAYITTKQVSVEIDCTTSAATAADGTVIVYVRYTKEFESGETRPS